MPPIDTSALAAIFAWVWDEYGKTIIGKVAGAAKERIRWDIKAQAYGQKVQRLYGEMQILGQPKPVSLESIYTAINLLDRPTALSRYTVEEMQAEFTGRGSRYFHAWDGEEKRSDGLDLVKRGKNLFILGKPGAGKTTFLRHVALSGVSGRLGGRVPIFIELKRLYDRELSVFDYVVEQFDICNFPDAAGYLEHLLKAGKAILLFDGLDEVNEADGERARIIRDVNDFMQKYELCQSLITCRLAASDYRFQGYAYVEMADFDEGQIREFAAKWFGDDKNGREQRGLFLTELEKLESEGLRDLARVPLMLALLCLAFEGTKRLSSQRAELYEDALETLFKRWDKSKGVRRDKIYHDLTLKLKKKMLGYVAYKTFERDEYFIPRRTLERSLELYLSDVPNSPEDVDGGDILQAIIAQHGLFLERSHNIFSFAHLTFHEYFTASYIVESEARDFFLSRLVENYADPHYREVFLMTAAQLANAGEFFDLFIKCLATDAQERPAVVALLRHAMRQATAASGEAISAVSARSAYISFGLDLALDYDVAHERASALDGALAVNQVFALDLALDRALVFARDRALVFDRVHYSSTFSDSPWGRASGRRGGGLALDYSITFSDSLHARLARDAALVNARLILDEIAVVVEESAFDQEYVHRELKFACDLISSAAIHSANLEDELSRKSLDVFVAQINFTDDYVDRSELERLIGNLQVIMQGFDLVCADLKQKDWKLLNRYISGNLLLLQCLDQAVVADREAIKDRLLLLPEA